MAYEHTFSVRLPEDLVVELSRKAAASGRPRNAEITDLLRAGLAKQAEEAEVISRFLVQVISPEDLAKLGAMK